MFRWVADVGRGDWIRDGLGPFGPAVGSVVPRGFDAYARVLHRAADRGGTPVRWGVVARSAGTRLHPTAQWWRVARRPDWQAQQPNVAYEEPWPQGWLAEGSVGTRRGTPGEWPGGNPHQGELDHEQLAVLVGVLRRFTEPDAVTAAFWEGSSWQGGQVLTLSAADGGLLWRTRRRQLPLATRSSRRARRGQRDVPTGPDIDPQVVDGPKLELPQRDHIVFAGSLGDVAALATGTAEADVAPFAPRSRTPSLLWPDDRSWCVATEVDFDSTLVGGPRGLIDALLADAALEAREVAEDDSLGAFADTVHA
jgi:hypothetical protein